MTTKTKPAKWKQLSMPLLATLSGLLVVTGISLWGSFDFVSSAGGADIGTFSEDGKNPGLGGTLRGGQIADDELVSVE